MKIALFHFNNEFIRPVLLDIIKEFQVTEIHNFWPLPVEYGIEKELPAGVKIFNRNEELIAVLANNPQQFSFEKILPLDMPLLEKMVHEEHMCKRTLQRWAASYPSLFNPEQKGIYQLIDRWLNHTGYRYNSKSLSYNETHNLYLRLARYFNHIFKAHHIDLFLAELIPHGGAENVAWAVAKAIGLPSVYSYFAPATMYQFFMTDYHHLQDDIPKIIEELKKKGPVSPSDLRKDSREEYERVIKPSSEQALPFVGDFKQLAVVDKNTKSLKSAPIRYMESFIEKTAGKAVKSPSFDKLATLFIRAFGKKRSFQYKWTRLYNSLVTEPDLSKNYIYVTLHAQPEASSEPIGDYYSYQQLIVEMLAYYLPENWLIYIKEHRKLTDYNYRPLDFYTSLAALPNVKFVSKEYSTFKLIENCKAVGSLTSTAGWEGLFKNKPFLMFGNHLTRYAPGVFKINSAEDCEKAMKEVVRGVEIKKEDLLYFLKAVDSISIPTNSTRWQFIQKKFPENEWYSMVKGGYLSKISEVMNIKYAEN